MDLIQGIDWETKDPSPLSLLLSSPLSFIVFVIAFALVFVLAIGFVNAVVVAFGLSCFTSSRACLWSHLRCLASCLIFASPVLCCLCSSPIAVWHPPWRQEAGEVGSEGPRRQESGLPETKTAPTSSAPTETKGRRLTNLI